jgi:carboxylate-amine ligase
MLDRSPDSGKSLSKVQHRLRFPLHGRRAARAKISSPDAHERFEEATDFTVAVEEEFAARPGFSRLVNRFETSRPPRPAPNRGHLAGELIARGRDQDRQGRNFADVPRLIGERREELLARSSSHSARLGATGSTRGRTGRTKDHRHAPLPAQRRALRYVVWKNNTFGFHVHVGIRGADRAIR